MHVKVEQQIASSYAGVRIRIMLEFGLNYGLDARSHLKADLYCKYVGLLPYSGPGVCFTKKLDKLKF